jgi:PHD/YefM family antitoxin component YafN of YafNO toxin-antitoxin module
LQETIYWLSQPGIREDIDAGRREYAGGETTAGDDLRAEVGLPPQ